MRAIAAGLVLVLLAAVPGALLVNAAMPRCPKGERRILGLTVGFGLLVVVAYLCTWAGFPLAAPAVMALWTFGLWTARPTPGMPPVAAGAVRSRLGIVLAAGVIVAVSSWFAVPVLLRPLPAGWDPAFHVAATELIRNQGRLPLTLAPYEPTEPFNYPAALHCLMALFGRLSGLDSANVFNLTMVAMAPLVLLVAHALGARAGGHGGAGVMAVLLLGLTKGIGSLASHAAWGGLPNLASLPLIGAFVLASVESGPGAVVVTAVCAVALVVLHHLSFALVAFTVTFIASLEWLSERRLSAPVRASLLAVLAGCIAAGAFVLSRTTGRFTVAEAFHFDREQMITLARMIALVGWPVLAAGGLGWMLLSRGDPIRRLLAGWTIGLMAFWVTWDIVYRMAAFALTHHDFTAFTPSRGLTDAAAFLAIIGGAWVWRVAERLRFPTVAAGVCAVLLLGLDARAEQARIAGARDSSMQARRAAAFCAQARLRTPADAVIFAPSLGPIEIWLPYLCARELNYFPDRGYTTSDYRRWKIAARDPVSFARVVRGARDRPTYYLTRQPFPNGRLVFTERDWRLYELAP